MVVRFGCGLLLTVLVVVSALAVVYLPPWAAGLTIAVCLVAAGFLVRSGMRYVVRNVFEAKSKTLLGAGVNAHAIEEVDAPAAEAGARRYLRLDVTITPPAEVGPIAYWEPHELLLVPFDRDVSAGSAARPGNSGGGTKGSVHSAELVAADGTVSEAPQELSGQQRLHLVFACPAGLGGRAKLQYYLTSIGDLRLP